MFELSNPQGHRTYSVKTPFKTHYRKATCAEVECEPYKLGWTSTFDTSTDLGTEQARYVMTQSGRHFTLDPEVPPPLVRFVFPAGQQCFGEQHWVPLERDPFLIVREVGTRQHSNADNWVDDFQTHLDKLRTQYDRG